MKEVENGRTARRGHDVRGTTGANNAVRLFRPPMRHPSAKRREVTVMLQLQKNYRSARERIRVREVAVGNVGGRKQRIVAAGCFAVARGCAVLGRWRLRKVCVTQCVRNGRRRYVYVWYTKVAVCV